MKCSINRPKSKRPEPPPVELKEPGKGILIMPRFLDLEEAASKRKKVVFADSINPGDGTSSSDGGATSDGSTTDMQFRFPNACPVRIRTILQVLQFFLNSLRGGVPRGSSAHPWVRLEITQLCACLHYSRENFAVVCSCFFALFESLTGQLYSFESCTRANSPPRGSDTTVAQRSVDLHEAHRV